MFSEATGKAVEANECVGEGGIGGSPCRFGVDGDVGVAMAGGGTRWGRGDTRFLQQRRGSNAGRSTNTKGRRAREKLFPDEWVTIAASKVLSKGSLGARRIPSPVGRAFGVGCQDACTGLQGSLIHGHMCCVRHQGSCYLCQSTGHDLGLRLCGAVGCPLRSPRNLLFPDAFMSCPYSHTNIGILSRCSCLPFPSPLPWDFSSSLPRQNPTSLTHPLQPASPHPQ